MKTKADQRALLGKSLVHEDIVEYNLDGLDEDYRAVIEQINGRDIPPTFEELHEKLVNREAPIMCSKLAVTFLVTANTIQQHITAQPRNNNNSRFAT